MAEEMHLKDFYYSTLPTTQNLDNLYDDVALMSLLNSDLVDISLDYISELRSYDKSIFLYENLLKSNDECIKKLLGIIFSNI